MVRNRIGSHGFGRKGFGMERGKVNPEAGKLAHIYTSSSHGLFQLILKRGTPDGSFLETWLMGMASS